MEFRTCRRHWGAEFISDDVVRFRVWAEGQKDLTLRLTDTDIPMAAVGDGWFQIDVPGVMHGTTYQFVLQDGMAVPDPASRAQQADVNGPSVVIDPRRSLPTQREWQGRSWEETVIYELHIGTFTGEGTFRAAIDKLPYLAGLGITQLEVMPVSQFGGARGWGMTAYCCMPRTRLMAHRMIFMPSLMPPTRSGFPWCWISYSTTLARKVITCRCSHRRFSIGII